MDDRRMMGVWEILATIRDAMPLAAMLILSGLAVGGVVVGLVWIFWQWCRERPPDD